MLFRERLIPNAENNFTFQRYFRYLVLFSAFGIKQNGADNPHNPKVFQKSLILVLLAGGLAFRVSLCLIVYVPHNLDDLIFSLMILCDKIHFIAIGCLIVENFFSFPT